MADRGDVLTARRTFGFGRGDSLEHFIVLQSASFPGISDTVVVAPLRKPLPALAAWVGNVPIAVGTGTTAKPMVVVVPLLAAATTDRFEPEIAGRADPRTMAAIDRVLRALLALR